MEPKRPKKPPTASPARVTASLVRVKTPSARTLPGASAAARRETARTRRERPSRIAKPSPLTERFRAGNSVFRCGTVALVGRPNVGKSTLLNVLLGSKVAIVSDKPQTTRTRILGIQTIADAQILWLDIPGLHGHRRSRNLLNARMLRVAEDAIEDADLVVWVIDARSGVGPGDEAVQRRIAKSGVPWLVAVTQIDRCPRGALLRLVTDLAQRHPDVDVVPTSGRSGENLRELVRTVATRLPEGPALHPADALTDQTARRLVEEFVREKIFEETGKEVPYRTAVQVESFVERSESPVDVIHATILVDRESQKRILVGRGGRMVRTIGTNARRELERTLGRRIHLELFVKVREDWAESASLLDELGL